MNPEIRRGVHSATGCRAGTPTGRKTLRRGYGPASGPESAVN